MDYIINPTLMGGVINKVTEDRVKINLRGRLGVIEVPKVLIASPALKSGDKVSFYFSYLEVTNNPCDYDLDEIVREEEITPCLLGGKITEFNDTAIEAVVEKLDIIIRVPRRWVFTEVTLEDKLDVEFYLSRMQVLSQAGA
jgi:hypothetical protein